MNNDDMIKGQLLGLVLYCHSIQQTIQGLEAKRLRENQEALLKLLEDFRKRNVDDSDTYGVARAMIKTISNGDWDKFLTSWPTDR